jgi:hypothetical protein
MSTADTFGSDHVTRPSGPSTRRTVRAPPVATSRPALGAGTRPAPPAPTMLVPKLRSKSAGPKTSAPTATNTAAQPIPPVSPAPPLAHSQGSWHTATKPAHSQ